MIITDLQEIFAPLFDAGSSESERRFRAVREAGYLPTGGRGPRAARLSAEHVANAVFACFPTRLVAAPHYVSSFASLPPLDGDFERCRTLHQALVKILSDERSAANAEHLILSGDITAIIRMRGRRKHIFAHEDLPKRGLVRSVTFHSDLLSMLAQRLAPPPVVKEAEPRPPAAATPQKREGQRGKRIIRFKELKQKIGYCRVHITRLERADQFPKRIKLGPHSVAWDEDEVDAWLEEKKRARDQS